jgi:UDP-N-acetylglucosamine--N-acetylmuramyl-(pentapeptide) pyrophosphoryl-undecaprenol N-acetylglucosamine transferase
MSAKDTEKAGKILIAAGGTGGHIFPALAFGEWLQGQGRPVLYLSGSRPLEAEIYASRNAEPLRLPIEGSPLGGNARRSFRRWGNLAASFFRSAALLRRERPDVCFLFGGYVSLPPLLACRFLRVPAVMHEPNARAGKTTRLAARLGVPVASGWDECGGVRSFTRVGVPVRPFAKLSRAEAAAALGLSVGEDDFAVGVIGGSLGSASLESLTGTLAEKQKGARTRRRRVFVVLGDAPEGTLSGIGAAASNVHFVGRRWDMAPFYSLCDAVLCRAGASTLAELEACGLPALAIPWAGAADGHQEANARAFARRTGNPLYENEGRSVEKFLDECGAGKPPVPRKEGERKEGGEDACSALWKLAVNGQLSRGA